MQIYAINGSPRKEWNTATILQKVMDGAAEYNEDVLTDTINLYDFNYQGCKSCFACKLIGGPSYGKCVIKDEISGIMHTLAKADAIVFGSPIYFGDITGMLRRFMERFLFQFAVYDQKRSTLAPKKIRTGFIYTMNCTVEEMNKYKYSEALKTMQAATGRIFGYEPRVQYVNNTYQFIDYSKYKSDRFNEADKAAYKKLYFPIDCKNAMDLGAALAADAEGEPESPFDEQ